MSDVRPLLIDGAGPTGLALAHQCLRLGIQLRIIDKKTGPSLTSKAIGLQYRVSEVLAYMRLAERFLQGGGKPSRVNIYADGRRLVALHFEAGGRESGTGAFAPQANNQDRRWIGREFERATAHPIFYYRILHPAKRPRFFNYMVTFSASTVSKASFFA